jgi:hypothetical protein
MTDFEKKYNLKLQPGVDFNIRENHRIPQKMGVDFFVFGRTMYCKGELEKLPQHEFLHVAQFRKYGRFMVIMHYLFYLTINLFKYRDFGKAFTEVPFEVEAREFEKIPG